MDRRDKKGSRVEHSSAKLQHRSIVEVDTEAEVTLISMGLLQ